jgi:Na+/pantothenate symporter
MSYEPHESLVAPAREKSDILRLIVGLVATVLLYVVMLMLGGSLASAIMGDAWVQTAAMTPGLTTPAQMLTILASFGFMIAAVCLAVIPTLHARIDPLSGVNRCIHFLRRRLTIQSLV